MVKAFDARLDSLIRTLEHLVSLDTPSDDAAAVARALDFVEERMRALGAQCARLGAGDILQADLFGSGSASVLLLCHVDTVFGHGEAARRPFRVEGDRAYGPGVADMKGGVALALSVAEVLQTAGPTYRNLRLLFTGDEEMGALRSRDAILQAAQGCDAALVLEPGRPGGEVVSARKGVGAFLLRAQGRAAHAGVDPERGRSAVTEIARRIVAISDLNGRLPGATFNVGVFEGGTHANVVAEEAHCEIDVRIARVQDAEVAHELLRRAALRASDQDVQLTLEGEFSSLPMEKGPGTQWLLGHASAAAQNLGFTLKDIATGGGSDGNRLARAGIPVLDALGPVGGRAHSADEYIEVPSIPLRGALIAGIITRIAKERHADPA